MQINWIFFLNDTSLTVTDTSESGKIKPKKNVKWNESLLAKEKEKEREKESSEKAALTPMKSLTLSSIAQMHKNNNITLHQVNKKYDEFMLMNPDSEPNVIIPQLISFKHSSSGGSAGSSKRPNSSTLDDQKKINKIFADKFSTIINDDEGESGFYSYKNDKGEEICGGYDNYVRQLELNQENPVKMTILPKDGERVDEYFPNPFNHVGLTAESLLPHIPKTVRHVQDGSSGPRRFGSSRVQSAITHKQNLLMKCKEEEEQIASETFRVLKIRSLTFKPVTTYWSDLSRVFLFFFLYLGFIYRNLIASELLEQWLLLNYICKFVMLYLAWMY